MPSTSATTRKAHFIEIMKRRILSGELKPGDRIPPERDLAAELGLSRGSLNQGMLDLAQMGFLRVIPRKGVFVAEYVKSATPETIASIRSYDPTFLDRSLFMDLMDLRILIERECTRLACANLTPESLALLQAHTDAIFAADDEKVPEAVYLYHKCLTEISRNVTYAMVFQSFEKMIRNLIREHYKSQEELDLSILKFEMLTAAISRRDAYVADMALLSILNQASDDLGKQQISITDFTYSTSFNSCKSQSRLYRPSSESTPRLRPGGSSPCSSNS